MKTNRKTTEALWNGDAIAHYLNSTPGDVAIMAQNRWGEMVEIVGTFAEIQRLAMAGREFFALAR
jgi:hypothetical protein